MDKTKRTEILPTDKEGVSIMKFQPLAEAIEIFCDELAKDREEGSYYYAWQANIAMAFYDEFDRTYPKDNDLDIIGIANRAAKNFLDQLINHNQVGRGEVVEHTIESLDLKPPYHLTPYHIDLDEAIREGEADAHAIYGKKDYPMTEKEAFKKPTTLQEGMVEAVTRKWEEDADWLEDKAHEAIKKAGVGIIPKLEDPASASKIIGYIQDTEDNSFTLDVNELRKAHLNEGKGEKMVEKTPSELIKQTIELAEEVKKQAGDSEAEGWIPYYQFVNNNIKGLPDVGKISDGYHTFDELYNHRCYLWLALCKLLYSSYGEYHGYKVWRTDTHSDGERWKGWFILGVGTEAGEQMTYHLPSEMWSECGLIEMIEKAPEFDDHSSEEVLVRLGKIIKQLTGI